MKKVDAAAVEEARETVIKACRDAGVPLAIIQRAIGGSRLVAPKKPKAWKKGAAPTIEQVVDVFLAALEKHADRVELADLQSARVLRVWAGPRAVAMWVVKAVLRDAVTLDAIGRFFNRDHSTALHAISTSAEKAVERDPRLAKASRDAVAFFKKRG